MMSSPPCSGEEISKKMEAREEYMNLLQVSLIPMWENDEYNEDTPMFRLLFPDPSLTTEPETSSVRNPALEREDLDDSQKLGQVQIIAVYMASVAEMILRPSALVLTIVLIAMNRNGHLERKQSELSYAMFYLSGYMLSVNVVVCLYSFAVLSLTIFQLVSCNTRGCGSLVFLLSIFQLDQTFAYLLISASLNTFGYMGNITCCNPPFKEGIRERALASAIVSLLAFFALAAASLVSGFRLVSRIRKASQSVYLAHCIVLDNGCKGRNSLAVKLLP